MILNAKDLSPDQRLVIESLLGRAVSERDEISIRALTPSPRVSPERRGEILASLKKHFAQVDAQRQPVSPEEADEIINEALRSTRPAYRPIH